jgi:acetyl esterase/lipase
MRAIAWTTLVVFGLVAFGGAAGAQSQPFDVQHAIVYATHDGVALLGDLYSPRAPGKYPAIVAVHGGGWQAGSREAYQYWGPFLARHGYVLFTIDYRFTKPGVSDYPNAVHDVRAAVQFLRGRSAALKVDPARLALMGDSAGAYLAALVALAGDSPVFSGAYQDDAYATQSTKVKAVAVAYGVYDLVQQWNHDQITRPRDQIEEKFLGVPPMENRRLYFDASPMSYAIRANNATSFFLTYGTEDDIVDREPQSDAFLLALKQAGFYARNAVMQGYGHFWLTDAPVEEPGTAANAFAARLLRFLADRL